MNDLELEMREWNLKLKEPKGDFKLKSGIDDFKILDERDTKNRYEFHVSINKKTPIFDLYATYIIKFGKKGKKKPYSKKKMIKQCKTMAIVEANSLLTVCLEYSNMFPPFPFLFDVKEIEIRSESNVKTAADSGEKED